MTATTQTAAQPRWFIDNLAIVHVDGRQTGDAYSLSEVWGARGDMPPLHIHHRDDETFYVLSGTLRLLIGGDGEEIVVEAGQAALAPRGVPHVYRVESDEARWLVVNSPAGFEEFVRAASEPAPRAELPPRGRPADPAALAAAAAEYGIEILGPPGMLPSAL